jgi:hypothetical protein
MNYFVYCYLFLTDETFQLKKNVRKLAHKADYQPFTAYIDAVSKHIHTPDTGYLLKPFTVNGLTLQLIARSNGTCVLFGLAMFSCQRAIIISEL